MALDPELRAYLDAMRADMAAMEQRLSDKVSAVDAKADAAREEAVAARQEAREGFETARREAGAMMESIIHEIRALPEGLSALQRQEADRLDASREEAMLNRHVLPLEASAVNHEQRITAVERHR